MTIQIDKNTLEKYDVCGPRYTSYPTAPQWSSDVNANVYAARLKAFGQNDKTLSLYIHIPFCEQLCYFCACNKVIRASEAKVGDEFLNHLFKEMDMVAVHIGQRKLIRQLHLGGGTPTYLSESQLQKLFTKVHSHFDIDFQEEIAIEIDPRTVSQNKLKTLRDLGFNRLSMGVQDFDAKVQDDINRIQPFEQVRQVHQWCKDLKFISVNFDLIYGLPYQTRETFAKTVDLVIRLRPDRIALYSFAYVPWLSKPQNKFNLEAIPVHDEKLDIFIQSRDHLLAHGYEAIAMDHFALTSDDMAKAFNQGKLHRNFMGYTLKPADEYIGLGPSAIGFLENTYIQNVKVLPQYYEQMSKGQLPVERGKVLSADDQIRQWVINRLMCRFEIDKKEFLTKFGFAFEAYFTPEGGHIHDCIEDGLISENPRRIRVTDLGKIFIRNVCMGFDWYLRQNNGHQRFSRTV
ncbi:MAG: oxygen-independent coproporphyrinogen III oxidase [Candidatus Omnitrophica bacterium]|nr:oxygen-independent coproporphyrinogen III oxidase [Candidatus Omnitrophota bacterium]